MLSTRARGVLCLALFAGIAAVTGGLVDPPQFDVISGAEWTARVADRDRLRGTGADRLGPLAGAEAAAPVIASGLILLASGLIAAVGSFGLHVHNRLEPLTIRLVSRR